MRESKLLIVAFITLFAASLCQIQAQKLDRLIDVLDSCVQNYDRSAFVGPLAETLKMKPEVVNKGLDRGLKCGELALIKAIAAKTGQTTERVMELCANRDWAEALQKAQITLEDVEELIDAAFEDLAFRLMDSKGKSSRRR